MRIRSLILMVLTVGWVLPGGALACARHTDDADAHSHAARHDDLAHSQGASDHRDAAHDHAVALESQMNEPLEAPICCSDDARTPTVVASPVSSKLRPKASSVSLLSRLPEALRAAVLPSGALLRLRQSAPLPYARTRRPLLI